MLWVLSQGLFSMLKKITFAGLGIALLASPLLASADTASELRAKIESLLAQVRQLQAQIDKIVGQGTTSSASESSGTLPADTFVCPSLKRVLKYGASGDDVTQLQQYLKQQGVFTGNATGFFGPATEAAIRQLQAQNGIVSSGNVGTTGWGAVGPTTRAWIVHWCRGGNKNFSASPTSGTAPLAVTFRTTTSPSTNNGTYTVEFGDGTTGEIKSDPNAPRGICIEGAGGPCNGYNSLVTTHTYTANGTYVAKLMYQEPFVCNAPPGAACMQVVAAPKQVGVVIIRVGTQTNNATFSASPTSGTAPLNVAFSTRIPQEKTDGTYTVDFGDGTSGQVNVAWLGMPCAQDGPCYRGVGSVSYTYTTNGAYTAKLIYQPPAPPCNAPPGAACTMVLPPSQVIGTVTITVDGTVVAGAPSITGLDGPASLAVGEQGTWTVHASVPPNADQNIRYSVVWGDEARDAFAGITSLASANNLQTSASFTHVYGSAGTYIPRFTASNSAGGASASASVVVGKDTTPLNCPQYMPPLCSSNETLVGGGYGSDGCQLAPRCVSNTTTSGTFTATPKEGAMPLMVTFTGVGNSVSFGDGGPTYVAAGTANIGTMTHVYLNGGDYTATSDGRSVRVSVTYGKLGSFADRGAPQLCVYNDRTYQLGASVDVPTRSCSFDRTFTGATACTGAIAQVQTGTTFIQRYTCKNGQWTDSNGIGVEGQLVSATSCTVSDGTVIANGQIIVQGFGAIAFDQYNTYGKRFMTTKCQNGTLFSCDASGANCTQAQASDPNANLASALMAIESALKAIIAKLGQ